MHDTDQPSASDLQLELGSRPGPDRGPPSFAFRTRDGLLSNDEIRPAERLLATRVGVEVEPRDDVLVPDANYGVVGVVLAAFATGGDAVMAETSARAANCCRENAARNGVGGATVELGADVGDGRGGFDVAAHAPKPYDPTDVVRERIAGALSRLAPGGTYYLAGTKAAGVGRYADTLSTLADDAERVTVADGCHLYRAVRPAAYEAPRFVEEREFRATVGEYTCRFLTQPGLFSADELDDGTAALLEHATVDDGARVLDCCCGYGAVGAFVGARTDCSLWATDDDAVATGYARRNYERNGVAAEDVTTADCCDGVAGRTFDAVLTNPPTHAGKGVTRKLFGGVREVLADDGTFWLVANRIMDYPEYVAEFGFDTEVVAGVEGFDVIRADPE